MRRTKQRQPRQLSADVAVKGEKLMPEILALREANPE
jgi:hypothetical protein